MKIYNIKDINTLAVETAVTVGMFDGVHVGHRQMVSHLAAFARERSYEPVVVTFRNHPRAVLYPGEEMQLLTTFDERMELLESCGVGSVALLEFDDVTARLSACDFASDLLCKKLRMRFLLLGYDNKFGSRAKDDFGLLPSLGRRLGFEMVHDEPVLVDGVDVSSTKIRKALMSGDIDVANRMLGMPYFVFGKVVNGRHVGREIGFPTANVELSDKCKLLPADGVYAMRVEWDGRSYAAMGNLGSQPTYGLNDRVLEIHIIDFDGDIYNETIKVDFLKKIRDIQQFGNTEELVAQLYTDKAICKRLG